MQTFIVVYNNKYILKCTCATHAVTRVQWWDWENKQNTHHHTPTAQWTHLSVTLNLVVESTRSMSIRILYDTYLGMVSFPILSVLKTRASSTAHNIFVSFCKTEWQINIHACNILTVNSGSTLASRLPLLVSSLLWRADNVYRSVKPLLDMFWIRKIYSGYESVINTAILATVHTCGCTGTMVSNNLPYFN